MNTDPHISFIRQWSISSDTERAMGECNGMIEMLKWVPLEPEVRRNLLQVALIKGAMATTAIEGNTLSEDEVQGILEGRQIAESRHYMQIEVENVIRALNELLDEVAVQQRAELITPRLILRFHKMIGQNLGEYLEAIPGQFRRNNVIVGSYRGPEYNEVDGLMQRLCDWSRTEFHFGEKQTLAEAVIEAIITHVYIAWIHPFGDGNGRTARLLEFYLLLRGGMPDFASHILSNFYNQTRAEYYRQLDQARKNTDLTAFIEYAVRGLKDGLLDVAETVRQHLLEVCWRNYVFEVFDTRGAGGAVDKRRRTLVLTMDLMTKYSFGELEDVSSEVARLYARVSERTIYRDVDALQELELIVRDEDGIHINTGVLYHHMPRWRVGS